MHAESAEEGSDDTGLDDHQVLDRQLVPDTLEELSPAHRAVLVEVLLRGDRVEGPPATSGYRAGTARSRLHYALQASGPAQRSSSGRLLSTAASQRMHAAAAADGGRYRVRTGCPAGAAAVLLLAALPWT